jgi:uncharacterized protein
MKILVDGDGCPRDVRAVLLKAALRERLVLRFYADRPLSDVEDAGFEMVVVAKGDDSADVELIKACEAGDICVTRDIPLAAELVGKGAVVIDTDGSLYDEANIRERLSMRNAMMELRFGGVQTGGKKPGKAALFRFANTFDRLLQQKVRERTKCGE